MPTLYLDYGSDLVLNQNGGLTWAVGWDEVRQRVLRRLMTNSQSTLPDGTPVEPEYIYDVNYGLDGRVLVDQPVNQDWLNNLARAVRQAVLSDESVDTSAPPSIQVLRTNVTTFYVLIGITLQNGKVGQVALAVGNGSGASI